MGFECVLVAVDQSMQASIVFNDALELAQRLKAMLVISHCFSESESVPYTDLYTKPLLNFSYSMQESLRQEIAQGREQVQHYFQQATDSGIPAMIDERFGRPGLQICKAAHDWDADLIIMGRRGHRRATENLLGSVSNYVVHHAPHQDPPGTAGGASAARGGSGARVR
ncbi:MAG: universal stress protein [Leptolyngbyaceae cyanobacterium MO_188.B28]|nr:universal stress protein [Leptolyngbyaceae cyanobacterium MO_188.B28]